LKRDNLPFTSFPQKLAINKKIFFSFKRTRSRFFKKRNKRGSRVKSPHGRATVKAILDLDFRFWIKRRVFFNPKSKIRNPKSESLETCLGSVTPF
jgi:hypothetical protein